MTTLITTDLHLTDNPRDADRWNLFPWLQSQVKKHKANQVLILGDLTDAKDRHSAQLVNKIANALYFLSKICFVVILKGNHDFIDEANPFFGFLNQYPDITFITRLTTIALEGRKATFLPCTRTFEETYADLDMSDAYYFAHQTFNGAIAENGTTMRGISPAFFAKTKGKIFSGDIHVPQKVGKIEYVGCPYRIRFGDSFDPRVILLKDGKQTDLKFPAKGKELITIASLDDLEAITLEMGTQVKIRAKLARADYHGWPELRKAAKALCEKRGWDLAGLELVASAEAAPGKPDEKIAKEAPADILAAYAKSKKLDKGMISVGMEILEGLK